MIPLLGVIASTVGTIFTSWMDTRKVKAAGKIALATAKVEAKVKKIEQQGQMDIQGVNDMKYSWKDEMWTIFFIGVLVCSFLPWTQPYIKEGFIFLKAETPDWFSWAFLGAIAATFGLRTWMGWKK